MKRIIMGFTAAGVLIASGCSSTRAAHWEYKTEELYLDAKLNPDKLNDLAKQGWQLVSITAVPNDLNQAAVAVFKRHAR